MSLLLEELAGMQKEAKKVETEDRYIGYSVGVCRAAEVFGYVPKTGTGPGPWRFSPEPFEESYRQGYVRGFASFAGRMMGWREEQITLLLRGD